MADPDRVPPHRPQFTLGRLLITPGALAALTGEDVLIALCRHARSDWGEVDPEDWKANDQASRYGGRLVSGYRSEGNRKFWVITEADRSATTVLLPEEY